MKSAQISTIDDYIASFPPDIRDLLIIMRTTIRSAAPGAEEAIKYAIPTFVLNGNLVHFAAFKNHIGFYPAPNGITEFSKELAAFERSKGGVRFPLDKPLPVKLIKRIVRYRVKQNTQKVKKQGTGKKAAPSTRSNKEK
jgi:uncharacterized protein YdhG (YjbR/CyaY superfamily)